MHSPRPSNEASVTGKEKPPPVRGARENAKSWSGNEIRETFLRFFESKGHRRVRSSSLVPHGDATLLFTNAGMNQFKDVFLGLEKRDYTRATSAQKCVRAGGKHNDLENVGFTKRHHTFFEMLGNFSFGDYFKERAIPYAWELITSSAEGRFAIPKDKLYVTVFRGSGPPETETVIPRDDEARRIWQAEGIPDSRIVGLGQKENFWQMGDTGPCGPCSEIHYDMGVQASELGHGTSAPECKFPCDCGRYVEIWNLVFMEYNRDESGKLTRLPKPSIDTGAGLERLASTLLNLRDPSKNSNYDTDLFVPLMKRAAELCGVDLQREEALEEGKGGAASLRVIADHARATTFLMADGVLPSNEGRGYVLRKIMRRAIRHARLLGQRQPVVLTEMVFAVQRLMEEAYPELRGPSFAHVPRAVKAEEEQFVRTLDVGLEKLEDDLRPLTAFVGTPFEEKEAVYSGEKAFKLYDTYGLPFDFIADAARDYRVILDAIGFERAMEEQRRKARASWKGGSAKEAANPAYAKIAAQFTTEPCFYFATSAKDARVEAIIAKNGPVGALKPGESGEVVLDRTVIYAESGGQMADTGAFYDPSGSQIVAEVTGAYYPVARLGAHVKQAGSLNAPDRLRFDFSHFAHVDAEELRDIEQQVNDEIRYNCQIETNVTSLEEALASGALAFFGDKYPESNVRVVTMPDPRPPRGFYSKELCGGTHVHRVGDIGVLKIVSEQSVAAGVRRIEAVTGVGALEHYQQRAQLLNQIASKLNVGEDAVLATVEKLSETAKHLEKELEAQKRKGALGQLEDLTNQVQIVKGVKVIAAEVANVDRAGLRQLVDSLRQKLGSGVVALGMPDDGKVALIAGVTKDLTSKVHAGKLIQALAKLVGGSGGGRPDLAEAGGKDTAALKSALQAIPSLIEPWL